MRKVERAIVQIHRIAADDDREIVGFQHRRGACQPFFPERFAAKSTVGKQSHRGGDTQRLKAIRIARAADCRLNSGTDASGECDFHGGRIN